MKVTVKEMYEKAARAAYDNSRSLLYEARLLGRRSKFARGYALCVLATEEFCKAFLYKSVSAGLVNESQVRKVVASHSEKIFRFLHIIITPYEFSLHAEAIGETIEHDKKSPDHADHEFGGLMMKIARDSALISRLTATFGKADRRKMNALYVDVRGDRVIIPKDTITRKDYLQIEDLLTPSILGFRRVLRIKGDTDFRKIVEFLDPGFKNIFGPIPKGDS